MKSIFQGQQCIIIKSADARVNSYILKEFKKVQFEIYNGYANGNIDFNGIC